MRKSILLSLALLIGAALAQGKEPRTRQTVENEMIETFCNYARINSQSAYPASGSDEFTMTEGQGLMADALCADIQEAVETSGAKGCKLTRSADNYVYFTIPASAGAHVPSIGISCHLDVTPEIEFGDRPITPIVERAGSGVIIRADGSTLLGADDKCGCAIAIALIRTVLSDPKIKHGELQFAFCPNEDIGMAADRIDSSLFAPEILFDIDGEDPYQITDSNFTARGYNVLFKGNSVHPADAKAKGLGDPVAAAAVFIASIPLEHRPENSEGREGYIHPWNLTCKDFNALVETRIRYFDKADGELYGQIVNDALAAALAAHPNVKAEIMYDGIQYENVAYTIHPKAHELVKSAAKACGMEVAFAPARGGTTASMFAAKGLKGGMCLFSGQNNAHSLGEYANVNEMLDAYELMLQIVKQAASPSFWK